MVSLVVIAPVLLEPRIFKPLTFTAESLLLEISMNSSLAPFGPRVRNSLITTGGRVTGEGKGVGEDDAVGLGEADGVGLGLGEGTGAGVGFGVGVGVGVGVTTSITTGAD